MPVRAGRIRVEVRGEGAVPVLLMPGAGGDHIALGAQARALVEVGFRAVTVDPRGVGVVDPPAEGYDYPTFVADLLAVHERLGLPPAHLFGHSLGSVVALGAAIREPGRFLSVAALSPWHHTDVLMRHFLTFLARAVETFSPAEYGPWLLTFLASREYLSQESQMLATARSMFLGRRALPPALLARHLLVASDLDLRSLLPRLSLPVFVLYAEHDRMIPPAYSEEVVRLLPNPRAHRIAGPGASHLFHFERSREVNEEIVRFFREASRR